MIGSSLLALLLCGFAGFQDKDPAQEQIDEFKKFYRPSRSTHERVEAIHVLEGLDRVKAAELLLAASGDPEFPVREAALQVLTSYTGPEVRVFLREAAADDKRTKSGARSGAIQALGALKDPESVPLLVKNLGVADFEVKRASVVALGRIGNDAAVEPILKLLGDPEPALRTAALDALGLLRKPEKCVPAMLPLLESPDWQVRAAAIQALGKMRVKDAIQPLIAALAREEGRLREDAAAALRNTTASDFGEDGEGWQRWWDGVKDRFVVPTDEELAKRKEAMEKARAQYAKREAEFVGVPTKSRRIVFVIDTSGSMEDLISDVANLKFKDRNYASTMKMEIVKDELTRTIESLGPEVRFNILTFATEVKQWKSSLVAANVVNKAGAVKYIGDLKPIGGASQGFNARAGLSGSAGMAAGKTNTYGALMAALDGSAAGVGARGAAVTGADYEKSYSSPIDTIYFLSDGVPSHGEYVERDEILAEVRRVNSLRKIVINTIAIGDMDHALMEQLSSQNYGTFVDLGK